MLENEFAAVNLLLTPKTMIANGITFKLGQTAHHIVQETKNNIYTNESRRILNKFNINHLTDPDNGAVLWGTRTTQVNQPGHPGRKCPAYHDGNVHSDYSDKRRGCPR